jgi:hypothetical protein
MVLQEMSQISKVSVQVLGTYERRARDFGTSAWDARWIFMALG